MKLLLSGDEYCVQWNNKYFLSDYGQTLIQRYLACYENINVVLRTKQITSFSGFEQYKNEVNDGRVTMCPIPFFQGPVQYARHYFAVRKAVEVAVEGCNIAILRLPSTVAFAAWDACVKHNIPYATEIVYDCYDSYKSSRNLLSKILWLRLHNKQVKACNNAIGVACVTTKYLQEKYFPINKDAPTSNYSSIEMPMDFLYHPRTFPQKNEFNIVHVSNQVAYNSRKGHNQLIEAVSKVKRNGVNANIIFVGKDYNNGFNLLHKYAESLGIANNVKFTGFLSRSKLRETLLSSDLAVLPTKAEGLPRVIIEAMAVGLPCITTPVSGNPELIDPEYLVNYNDTAGIAEAISHLLTDRKTYEYVSQRNFDRSLEFTADVLNQRRTNFYKKLKAIVNSSTDIDI